MWVTLNQTKSSVLGLGGIPISLGESLQSGKILRNTFDTIFGVRLVLVVAVFNSPLGVLLVIQFSWCMANDRSSSNILPLLDVTLGGKLIELETSLDLEGIVSHLIEETRGCGSGGADELII